MTGTVIQQGIFFSLGVSTTVPLLFGADWIQTYNQTAIAASANTTGYAFYCPFLSGAPFATGWEWQGNADGTAVNLIAAPAGSFAYYDSSEATPGAPVAITAISGATPPLVSTGSTAGLGVGSVVEIINTTGAQQFGGMSFSISNITANTSFALTFAPTIAAGTNGFYRIIPFDPIFYPRNRFITEIAVGATTDITMSVQTTYTVGQLVRVIGPAAYGAISQSINGLTGTILAINAGTNTATLNINSTGFGAFVFPLTAAVPFTQAQLAPVGSGAPDAGETSNSLLDATQNKATRGIVLAPGANGPAGVDADIVYWSAGSVFGSTNF